MNDEKSTALATATDAPSMDLGQMFQGMMELAKDPAVDPAKMSAMLDMQERMIDREALRQYRAAMHEARSVMPRITKDGKILNKNNQVQSRYAHYEAIDAIVRPLVNPLGLSYGFDYKEGERGSVLVTCIVSHVGGHEERFGPMPLQLDTSGSKNATQGAGSAGKYGQRYTLCAAFNIVTEGADDDGNMGRKTEARDPFPGLIDEARKASTGGSAAYAEWFKSLKSNQARGWLVDQGEHANLKIAATNFDTENNQGSD